MVGLLPWLQRTTNNGSNSYFASSSVSLLFSNFSYLLQGKTRLKEAGVWPSYWNNLLGTSHTEKNHVQRLQDRYPSRKPHVETAILRSMIYRKVKFQAILITVLDVIRNADIFHNIIFFQYLIYSYKSQPFNKTYFKFKIKLEYNEKVTCLF